MDELVTRLSRLDCCAISDALDKLGLPASISGIDRLSTDHRIAGRVLTVTLAMAGDRPSASRHLCTAAIEAAQPGDIIVIEQRTGLDAASWGGNLSIGAQVRGVAGVIVDGPVRDVDDSRRLDFPVFARCHTARTARGRIVEVATNQPITVGDVTVSPATTSWPMEAEWRLSRKGRFSPCSKPRRPSCSARKPWPPQSATATRSAR